MVLGDAHLILAAAIVCLVIVLLLYKEFKAVVFDPGFASALGWPVYWLDLLLMALVAAAVVIGLPAVGVILMAALLILPSVSAGFWTNRFSKLLVLSGAFGFAMGLMGVALSAVFSGLPAGPIIVLSGTGIFLCSLFFGAERGLLAGWLAQRRFERELHERRFLQTALEIVETRHGPVKALRRDDFLQRRAWRPAFTQRQIERASHAGLLRKVDNENYSLTAAGHKQAIEVTRGHRLWQAYLTEYPELAAGVADLSSPSIESFAPVAIVEALIEQLRTAGRWPDYAAYESAGHVSNAQASQEPSE
jgi:manganese/zinc/iron transport system permease protein